MYMNAVRGGAELAQNGVKCPVFEIMVMNIQVL
jgi:hypothetical protein